MPYFEIIVQHRDGSPATGSRVVLGGSWGMSGTVYTDRHGRAVVEISSQTPTIYVDGANCGKAHPGRSVVTKR